MKYVIIEDEEEAAERLERLVKQLDPEAGVLAVLESVEKAVSWIKGNTAPDLFMMDIHLADGHSFEIFQRVEVNAPVIFTTAYDSYAIDAFKVNSIHYLLKPVKKEELKDALEKYRKTHAEKPAMQDLEKLLRYLQPQGEKKEYQKRIMVRYGQHIKVFEIENAAYFYSQNKINFLCTFDGQRIPIDYTLDELESILDPARFFRLNRQFLISFRSIDQMFTYPKAKVKVVLRPPSDLESMVSSERSAAFKEWLIGK